MSFFKKKKNDNQRDVKIIDVLIFNIDNIFIVSHP
jgi:hypothetical protein